MSSLLEIRVPISPTPDFFRRIHFMAASLRKIGGAMADHEFVVCVGGDEERDDLRERLPWSKNYPITWRWANRELFRRDSYWETSREVFRQPIQGRLVMCADADVIFVREFSELVKELNGTPEIAGVIAHAPPIRGPELAQLWPRLCKGYGVPIPPPIHEYTGWRFMTSDRMTPVYYNFGMVMIPARFMEGLSAELESADRFVNSTMETFFRFQIALTLAIQKLGLPTRALPLRYNFPNDPQFDQKYPEELMNLRILHYLRCEIVHRKRDFANLEACARLSTRTDLRGSNEVLRQIVAELLPVVTNEENIALPAKGDWKDQYLEKVVVPDALQRDAPDVLIDGVENTGESLLHALAERLGRVDLTGLDLLDLGCGVRLTQTLINRRLSFGSYTGVEVSQTLITWLKENVERLDRRFRFVHWEVQNAMYNSGAPSMDSYQAIPVPGSYHVVTAYSLFTHLDPHDSALLFNLTRRVVRANGHLFFTAFCDPAVETFEDRLPEPPLLNAYYNPAYLMELIQAAGWKVLSHKPPEGYMMDSFLCQACSPLSAGGAKSGEQT